MERIYEGMFLVDVSLANDWSHAEAVIQRIMERAEAQLLFCRKWDERRLAYEIAGRKRGVYVLTYFKAPADNIGTIERDVQLSENILRVLVLQKNQLTEAEISQMAEESKAPVEQTVSVAPAVQAQDSKPATAEVSEVVKQAALPEDLPDLQITEQSPDQAAADEPQAAADEPQAAVDEPQATEDKAQQDAAGELQN